MLRPAVIDGVKCVIVDAKLNSEHPAILQDVIHFASKNNLQTEKQD